MTTQDLFINDCEASTIDLKINRYVVDSVASGNKRRNDGVKFVIVICDYVNITSHWYWSNTNHPSTASCNCCTFYFDDVATVGFCC